MASVYSGDRECTHLAIWENSMKAVADYEALGAKVDSGVGVMLRNVFAFFEEATA